MDLNTFKMFQEFQKFQEMMAAQEKPPAPPPPPPPPPQRFPEFVPVKIAPSFAEILAKAAPAPPPPPAPAPRPSVARGGGGGGDSVSSDEFFLRPTPYKMDYDWLLRWTIQMKPFRGDDWSQHPNLFLLYQHLYEAYPERFNITSEIKADDDGRTYFSYRYEKPGDKGYSTFHAYGHFVGRKFLIDSVDIRIGKEQYHDAAKFNQEKYE